jgi:hypothetical protein
MDLGVWDAVWLLGVLLVGFVVGWVAGAGPRKPAEDGPPGDPVAEGKRRARERYDLDVWNDRLTAAYYAEVKRLRLADDPLRDRARRESEARVAEARGRVAERDRVPRG